ARRKREDATRRGLDDDGRTALPAQLVDGHGLRVWIEREQEVVALDRHALELVELALRHRREAAVRTREIVVLGLLEPGARAALRRVAHEMRRERAVRVLAEVVRLPAHLLLHVRRERDLAVAGVDLPAVDRELRDADERVVLPVREPRGG